MKKKILFCDLDGTIITPKSGNRFPADITDWKFIPEVVEFIRQMYHNGYDIHIVTNQGGIPRYTSNEDFKIKMDNIIEELSYQVGCNESDITYNYCIDMKSFFRKPNAGMLIQECFVRQANPADCVMIGDDAGKSGLSTSLPDSGAAANAGVAFIHARDIKRQDVQTIVDLIVK
jgi:DNA 3'-phosphatase